MMSMPLIFIVPEDDYGILLEAVDEGRSIVSSNDIKIISNSDFIFVDEAFHLLYDGYKGLGRGDELMKAVHERASV